MHKKFKTVMYVFEIKYTNSKRGYRLYHQIYKHENIPYENIWHRHDRHLSSTLKTTCTYEPRLMTN